MDNWSEFVEGCLTGIVLRNQNEVVDMYLQDRSKRKYTLTACGVKELRVLEMRKKI